MFYDHRVRELVFSISNFMHDAELFILSTLDLGSRLIKPTVSTGTGTYRYVGFFFSRLTEYDRTRPTALHVHCIHIDQGWIL